MDHQIRWFVGLKVALLFADSKVLLHLTAAFVPATNASFLNAANAF